MNSDVGSVEVLQTLVSFRPHMEHLPGDTNLPLSILNSNTRRAGVRTRSRKVASDLGYETL